MSVATVQEPLYTPTVIELILENYDALGEAGPTDPIWRELGLSLSRQTRMYVGGFENWACVKADIDMAMMELDARSHYVLAAYYLRGDTDEAIGRKLGLPEHEVRQKRLAAIEDMARALGWHAPGDRQCSECGDCVVGRGEMCRCLRGLWDNVPLKKVESMWRKCEQMAMV